MTQEYFFELESDAKRMNEATEKKHRARMLKPRDL
jgi:hypothetical protein